jgi:hypothetical protein
MASTDMGVQVDRNPESTSQKQSISVNCDPNSKEINSTWRALPHSAVTLFVWRGTPQCRDYMPRSEAVAGLASENKETLNKMAPQQIEFDPKTSPWIRDLKSRSQR